MAERKAVQNPLTYHFLYIHVSTSKPKPATHAYMSHNVGAGTILRPLELGLGLGL